MAVPTGTHTATVSLGYVNSGDGQQIYYLASYYNSSCYSFYKGPVRWIAISQYPGASITIPEGGTMFKSLDNGATWALTGGLSPQVSSGGGASPSPAYDVGFAAFDDVGLDPNAATATKITAMGNSGTGILAHYAGFLMDFNFVTESWGSTYNAVDYPSLDISAGPVPSSTPSGGFAHTVIQGSGATPPYITTGASVVGSSPWMVIDADGNAHIGDDPGGNFTLANISPCGNVRIRGGSLIFAQANLTSGHMEVLTRPVASGAWTVETVSILNGLYSLNQAPWMSSETDLFYVGANRHSIYLTQKVGGVWGTPVLLWSPTTDTNPDLAGATGGRVWQLIASCNPVLGGLDVTFEYDGIVDSDAMLTFHLPPNGAGWSDLVGHCSDVASGPVVDCGDPPDGRVGTAYSHDFPAVGGTAPYVFTVTAGTLPPGLLLDSGSGNLSGIPTLAGDYSVTMTVTDADAATDSVNCALTIIPEDTLGLGCAAPPNGVVGVPYTHSFPVSGGTPPFTFAIISGILPVGLTLDSLTGEVSGTPTLAGDFPFTIQVSDDFDSTVGTCDIVITVTDVPGPGIECDSPPSGTVGISYSHTFPVTDILEGSTVTYSITGGALPPGLALNTATGEVTGTPTTEGNYHFTITLTVADEPEVDILTDFAGDIIYTTAGDTIIVTHGIGGL